MGLAIGWSKHSATAGLAAGVATGVLFGIAIAVMSKMAKPFVPADLDSDETILHQGPANHFKGREAVGGSLVLTNKRLRFRSHKINVAKHDESFAIAEIKSIAPSRTLGFIPNGVVVELRAGGCHRFVVSERSTWVSRVRELILITNVIAD